MTADAGGLSIDDAMYMDRASIENAYCDENPDDDGRYAVHLEGRFLRRGCAVYVDTAEEGRALLAALQRDPSASAAHYRALPPWAKHIRWLAVLLTASPWVLVNVLRFVPPWGIGFLVALYGVVLVPTFLPQRVDVGHDGVFLRWLGNKRFIPFSAIEIASGNKLGVDLFLHGERHVEIRLTQKDGGAEAQVQCARRAHQGGHRRAGRPDAGRRGGVPHARRAAISRAGCATCAPSASAEMGGYRAAAIPRERLWAVVENPAADPSAREGAALALSATLDDDDRSRLAAPRAEDGAAAPSRGARRRQPRAGRVRTCDIALETAEGELDEPGDGAGRPPRSARKRAKSGPALDKLENRASNSYDE